MRYSKDDRIEALVREYLGKGWGIKRGAKHWIITAPNGRSRPIPGTPSDGRSALNLKSQLRRMAAETPQK